MSTSAPDSVADIVPRWEWRTFGAGLRLSDEATAALEPVRVQESEELYFLSLRSDASVKVRDGVMDVKRLERVNDAGLEQWRPVMKAAFPLSADDVDAVLAALGLTLPPALVRSEYELDELVEEVLKGTEEVEVVPVNKTRRRFSASGCLAESTTIEGGGRVSETIAVESEDPAHVEALVRRLGFPIEPNVCVPRGLKELVGFGTARYAVIDVGTNSVKFHVAERTLQGEWLTAVDRSEITRLGEGLDMTGELSTGAMGRTLEAIAGMAEEARQMGARAVAAVGTAGLRIATNSDVFVAAVRERTGVAIEVISGEEEGRLAYLAVQSGIGLSEGSLVVFDTGGGSSQFTFGRDGEVEERFSVNVGAVRFTERFGLDGPVTEDVLSEALDAIGADLSRLDGRPRPDALVALGGVVTNLAAVKHELATYDPDVVQGAVLDVPEIVRQIELYRIRTADERRQIVGLQAKRAEVMLAGACVVRATMAKLGCDSLTVSDRGLRHGVLLDRFGRKARPAALEP
jgi:exopolyphosphatase/guanosine-5'-triphosphate,3'-diphosphate pyrophosphatase